MTSEAEDVVAAFGAELEAWRAAHPGWTPGQQIEAFSPYSLWRRAGGFQDGLRADPEVYRRLMLAAGYLIPQIEDEGDPDE